MDALRNVGFLLKDLSRLYSANFVRHAAELKLTLAHCKVLWHLEKNEGVSQVQLAALTDTDQMTLVRILDRMEGEGLLERRPDPTDRRARRLFLLPPAAQVLREIRRFSDEARAEATAGFSDAEHEQLLDLMERVHANLVALVPCASEAAAHAQSRKRAGAELARISQETSENSR